MGSGGGLPDPAGLSNSNQEPNYVKEAFNLQYNWIGLAGAEAFALVSGTFLPLALAGGLELMYLAIIPQNSRFQRLVRSWKFAEQRQQHQQKLADMLRSLPHEMQSRYVALAQLCGAIRGNFAQLSSTSQMYVQQMEQKLDGLVHSYARLLYAAYQQRQYMNSTDPNEIKNEIYSLQKHLDNDPPNVQDINKKRIEILTKRLDKYQKLCENREVVDAQCAAVEDVLKLMRDQSVTLRDPQQVSDQLGNLVHDVEQTEQTVQQVEAIFSGVGGDLSLTDDSSSSTSTSSGTRIRS